MNAAPREYLPMGTRPVEVRSTRVAGRAPVLAAAVGASCIAASATLIQLSGADPITAAIFRCAYALPFLALLALPERRRWPALRLRLTLLAGVFFAADLVCWHFAIADVGAGIATVLVNLQVVFVALAARVDRRVLATIPVVLLGIVLVSGAAGGSGQASVGGVLWGLGAAVAYAAFLLVLKQVSGDQALVVTPLAVATLSATACTALVGLVTGHADFVPSWPSHGWLVAVALSGQVLGWLLISRSLPRLPVVLTSLILMIQPAAAVLLAAVVLGERPTLWQLAGSALILLGVWLVHRRTAQRT